MYVFNFLLSMASCLQLFNLYGCENCSPILETENISEQGAEENVFTEEG
jgi:hypothetical protein